MNYLAHAFLSHHNNDLLIGNFIADHLRGNDFKNYPVEIIEGIYHHRKIDAFTDAHPLFKASKRIFYEGFEKFSGVLVDIYFDHFLARSFDLYSPLALKPFSEKVYAVYLASKTLLPANSLRFLDYVLANNIYTAYAELESIEHVLGHLSKRINRPGVYLNQSTALFKKNEGQLQANFGSFFKDISQQFLPPQEKQF